MQVYINKKGITLIALVTMITLTTIIIGIVISVVHKNNNMLVIADDAQVKYIDNKAKESAEKELESFKLSISAKSNDFLDQNLLSSSNKIKLQTKVKEFLNDNKYNMELNDDELVYIYQNNGKDKKYVLGNIYDILKESFKNV